MQEEFGVWSKYCQNAAGRELAVGVVCGSVEGKKAGGQVLGELVQRPASDQHDWCVAAKQRRV